MFQGVVNRIFWNPEYIFVPMNASCQEESWLAGSGKGCDCGTVHKIITKMFPYTKRCFMSRWFSWYQFGNKWPLTFPVSWQLVWWNHHCPRTWDKGFFHVRVLVPPYTNLQDSVELFSCPPISKILETLSHEGQKGLRDHGASLCCERELLGAAA